MSHDKDPQSDNYCHESKHIVTYLKQTSIPKSMVLNNQHVSYSYSSSVIDRTDPLDLSKGFIPSSEVSKRSKNKQTNKTNKQNKKKRFLELELKLIVSCHVGAKNRTQVLWRSSKCSQSLSLLSILVTHLSNVLIDVFGKCLSLFLHLFLPFCLSLFMLIYIHGCLCVCSSQRSKTGSLLQLLSSLLF